MVVLSKHNTEQFILSELIKDTTQHTHKSVYKYLNEDSQQNIYLHYIIMHNMLHVSAIYSRFQSYIKISK
jgi:hypothetical protein